MKLNSKKIGITILTGPLGAGKSTLIKNLLKHPKGLKIAVVINEVGENSQSIDQTLVEGSLDTNNDFKMDLLDLPAGCVCCTVRGATLAVLEKLTKEREVDCILLETTGIADPGPIASDLWVDDELLSPVYLDSIVTIVDCINFENHLKLPNNIHEKQIRYADTIILNKYDEMANENTKEKVTSWNSNAKYIHANHSMVDIFDIIDANCYSKKEFKSMNFNLQHLDNYSIQRCTYTSIIDFDDFEKYLMDYLWTDENIVYRLKGHFSFEGKTNLVGLQGIMDKFEFFNLKAKVANGSELLIIGKDLQKFDFITKMHTSRHTIDKDSPH
eukprot:NODE_49_length_31687_cov_0.791123.p11 type:complete len:328 gc:universal NODE_49_length_31687_cov_0.791123:7338-8321(+)